MGLPSSPNNRKEVYLSNIAGQGTALPSEPHTREEEYLDYIAKNGGGGGGTGDGDMKKAIYDDDLAVATAGGIADYVASAISGKVDAVSGKGLSTNDYDNTAKGIVDGVNTALDGKVSKSNTAGLLKNDGTVDQTSYATAASVTAIKDGSTIDSFGDVETALSNKVDKVSGKGLSTNDYDASAKSKLDNLANIKSIGTGLDLDASTGELTATGAEITIDSAMSSSSTNPVQNKVITSALAGKQNTLTFDNFPIAGSTNPVTSGGIKSATTEIWGVLGTIEAGLTSTHAYEVGDHIICWIGFAEVIAPIAVGDELQRNVNVIEGDVADAVSDNLRGVIANTQLIADTVGFSAKNKWVLDIDTVKSLTTGGTWNGNSYTRYGVTATINPDNTISVTTGSGSSTDTFIMILGSIANVKDNIMTGCPSGGGASKYKLSAYRSGDTFEDYGSGVVLTDNESHELRLVVYSGQTISTPIVYKPMIRDKNILDNSYEMGRNTTAFPRDEQAVLGAKNWLETSLARIKAINTLGTWNDNVYTFRGGVFTVNSDLTVSIVTNNEFTPSVPPYFYIQAYSANQVLPFNGLSMKLRGCPSGGSDSTYRFRFSKMDGTNDTYDYGEGSNATVVGTASSGREIYFQIFVAISTPKILKPMITLATDPDPTYVPYAMTNRELTENVNNVLANMINLAFTVTSANYTGDLDDLDAGIRYCTNATTHNPNNAWGYCFTIKNPSNKIQIFVAQASDGIWYRRYASNSWQAWKTVTLS